MKLKGFTIFFGYLKQLLLVVALLYAFSNCQVKKSILHFASIEFKEVSQKNQTQIPVQDACNSIMLKKNSMAKKAICTPQTPLLFTVQSYYFQAKKSIALNKLQIHPVFEFNKKSITYPPMFIVFKKLKIAPLFPPYLA